MTRLGYFKGEEEKALWYYRQRIKYEIDPKEREKLGQTIKELERNLDVRSADNDKKDEEGTLTSISLHSHS